MRRGSGARCASPPAPPPPLACEGRCGAPGFSRVSGVAALAALVACGSSLLLRHSARDCTGVQRMRVGHRTGTAETRTSSHCEPQGMPHSTQQAARLPSRTTPSRPLPLPAPGIVAHVPAARPALPGSPSGRQCRARAAAAGRARRPSPAPAAPSHAPTWVVARAAGVSTAGRQRSIVGQARPPGPLHSHNQERGRGERQAMSDVRQSVRGEPSSRTRGRC